MKSPSPMTAEITAEMPSDELVTSAVDVTSHSSFPPAEYAVLLERVESLASADSAVETLQLFAQLLHEIGVGVHRLKYDCCGNRNEWKPSVVKSEIWRSSVPFHCGAIALELFCTNDASDHSSRAVSAILKACALQIERCLRRVWQPTASVTQSDNPQFTSENTGSLYVSTRARQLREDVQRVARLPFNLLITGQTGTGKTLAAREIHRRSSRDGQPFMELNCANLPEQLVEAELFGYRKGAFTGADHDRKGLFEEADGGTLFLDEIGDLPLSVQNKFLKAIEEKQFKRLGTNRFTTCDVRIIAATSRNLQDMICNGTFREDLYCRLATLKVETPALHERREDIPDFVTLFLGEAATEVSRASEQLIDYRIETGAVDLLTTHRWMGNIRALRNAVYELTSYAPENGLLTMEQVQAYLAKQIREQSRRIHSSNGHSTGITDQASLTPDAQARLVPDALRAMAEDGDIVLPIEVCLLRRGETLKQWTTRVKRCGIEAARHSSGGKLDQTAARLGLTRSSFKGQMRRICAK